MYVCGEEVLGGGIKASVANSTDSGTAGVTQGAWRSCNLLTSEPRRCPPSAACLPKAWRKVMVTGEAARAKPKGWAAIMKAEFYSRSVIELSHSSGHVAPAVPATHYEGVERSLGTASNCV